MKTNIIEVNGFTKKYGDFKAVDNISFCVEEGSIFAFLGPNGAGKSTTINTLCTILDKTEGSLKINGNDVGAQKSKVRQDIGIVFQESTLDTKLTVEENLRFHCDFYNVPKNEVNERIDFVLELVDLQKWKKAPVSSLSGGMKRRVEIARGLLHYPKVLFLDEPTTGLDPQTRSNIWDYIKKLQKQKNITVFLTTHYMDEAEICNKVAIMDHGKIVAYDTPQNLKSQYTSTIMKIRTESIEKMEEYLKLKSIGYEFADGIFTVISTELDKALDVITNFKSTILDLEINKGTLNDVFLSITGKEIRS
ncbi:MAG TPA: ATP-binding cassette domain-containing protein [Clostridia bacterium]